MAKKRRRGVGVPDRFSDSGRYSHLDMGFYQRTMSARDFGFFSRFVGAEKLGLTAEHL